MSGPSVISHNSDVGWTELMTLIPKVAGHDWSKHLLLGEETFQVLYKDGQPEKIVAELAIKEEKNVVRKFHVVDPKLIAMCIALNTRRGR